MPSSGSESGLAELLALGRRLAAPEQRQESAAALARALGADDLLIFVQDADVGRLLPAPGFARTLPDGQAWRAFLDETLRRGVHRASLKAPTSGRVQSVLGVAADDGSVLALLGGQPGESSALSARPLVGILADVFRGEEAARSAAVQANLARQNAAEAQALALTLDRARARVEALAHDNGRLYRQAEDALRARDQFLAIASHELKTPLTSAKIGIQLLRRLIGRGDGDTQRVSDLLARVDASMNRLDVLMADLLDVSRLRLGQLPLRLELLDPLLLVQEAVAERRAYLEDRHSLEVVAAGSTAPTVRGDPARLQLVLANLLDNAVKYSPQGGCIRVRLDPIEGGACIAVGDPGIGVPQGGVEALFQPFGRASNAQRQHLPGMGLGLFISRQIVEQHHGRIWAESPGEGLGTTVSVWLPAASS